MSRPETGAQYDRRQEEKWDKWAASADTEMLRECLYIQENMYAELLERHAKEMIGCRASIKKIHDAIQAAKNRPKETPNAQG